MAVHSLHGHEALMMVTQSAAAQRSADREFRSSLRIARAAGWSWMDIALAAEVSLDGLRARMHNRPSPLKALDGSLELTCCDEYVHLHVPDGWTERAVAALVDRSQARGAIEPCACGCWRLVTSPCSCDQLGGESCHLCEVSPI